ncbi:MAG: efflux RND transporter periplasmic adaptor subunit [Clostridia bacterium]|nr:efflux RND transporter periplasmic adaptor subunit [Clostridia bacterium]
MKKGKPMFIAVFLAMIVVLSGITFFYWYNGYHYIITENAYVDGTIIKVGPQVPGKYLEIMVSEGDRVTAGQIIAKQSDRTLTPGADSDLTVVRAPISGKVIKRLAHPGEVGAPGQPAVWLCDLSQVYVTANIEETHLARVQRGQQVELRVDGVRERLDGRVLSVGEATNSIFSMLPTRTTSGSFTKVAQTVPVKIVIEPGDQELRLGVNAKVKILVRE